MLSHTILPTLCPTFFFTDTAPTEIYTLSLHDALPIFELTEPRSLAGHVVTKLLYGDAPYGHNLGGTPKSLGEITREDLVKFQDRKSTRLNSSHSQISYAVFCLKKKKK